MPLKFQQFLVIFFRLEHKFGKKSNLIWQYLFKRLKLILLIVIFCQFGYFTLTQFSGNNFFGSFSNVLPYFMYSDRRLIGSWIIESAVYCMEVVGQGWKTSTKKYLFVSPKIRSCSKLLIYFNPKYIEKSWWNWHLEPT